jgi:hypothetical protein
MTPDFEAVGERTSADLQRLRALINPEALPVWKCATCGKVAAECECPREAA